MVATSTPTAGRSASTDDAYVQADKIVVSSDVSARVVAVEVKDNQQVKAGQNIAEMGSTGTDRVKLHFEIRRQGKPVDPLQYLPRR